MNQGSGDHDPLNGYIPNPRDDAIYDQVLGIVEEHFEKLGILDEMQGKTASDVRHTDDKPEPTWDEPKGWGRPVFGELGMES